MPSIVHTALADGFAAAMLPASGEPVQILTGPEAGRELWAMIHSPGAVGLESLLGDDPRDKVVCSFAAENWPSGLESQNRIKDSAGQVWRVVGRTNTTQRITVDFEVVAIVEGKDK